jgi:hypothetical protein
MMKKDYRYPEEKAVKVWDYKDMQCSIVKGKGTADYNRHYCGYVRLAQNPYKHVSYPRNWKEIKSGISCYVPVHGGITYGDTTEEDGSVVFGFDCAHYRDEERWELFDIDWLTKECQRMADGVLITAKYEDAYESAKGEERASILEKMEEELGGLDISDNYGIMLKALGGVERL